MTITATSQPGGRHGQHASPPAGTAAPAPASHESCRRRLATLAAAAGLLAGATVLTATRPASAEERRAVPPRRRCRSCPSRPRREPAAVAARAPAPGQRAAPCSPPSTATERPGTRSASPRCPKSGRRRRPARWCHGHRHPPLPRHDVVRGHCRHPPGLRQRRHLPARVDAVFRYDPPTRRASGLSGTVPSNIIDHVLLCFGSCDRPGAGPQPDPGSGTGRPEAPPRPRPRPPAHRRRRRRPARLWYGPTGGAAERLGEHAAAAAGSPRRARAPSAIALAGLCLAAPGRSSQWPGQGPRRHGSLIQAAGERGIRSGGCPAALPNRPRAAASPAEPPAAPHANRTAREPPSAHPKTVSRRAREAARSW